MALNHMGLGFVFTARDLASGAIGNLERNFMSLDQRVGLGAERIQTSFRQLGVGLAVLTAGAATVGAAFSLANAAGQFERGLAAVGAVTRATTAQMRLLRDAAIEAGIVTQYSPDEAIEGLTSLATAGQTAEQAARTLIPVLDLTAGALGQLNVAQSAEAVVGTLNAYGLAADEAASVTDRLLRVTQLTNFQARDFESGLAKAAASGAVFGQELNDVLITMGLLRNRNIDASSSSTAFREAVRRVGSDVRAQQAITETGIDIFDQQTGRMRSIVDVMLDFSEATQTMTEEERNRRVVAAFGARGLLAFNAVLNASFTTMRDGAEVTLRGAEAIAALRNEMEGAGGTALEFREKLLDTFEGQKDLLGGIVKTLIVVLGEPFTAVFKPMVSMLATVFSSLIKVVQAIPGPVKRALAAFVVGVGAVMAMVGAVIAAKAGFALLVIGLKAAGITLGGLLATLLPAVLIFGVLALAIAGFVVAFRNNFGGIADFARGVWEKVSLAFQGLMQLFEEGGFSGAVREELNRAENRGLKDFLINVYLWVNRIQNFFAGLATGFSAGIEAARPTIDAFMNALRRLGTALGFLSDRDDAGTASSKFREFGATGERVGRVLAVAFELIVKGLTAIVQVARGVAEGWEWIRAGGAVLWSALAQLGSKIGEVTNHLFGSTSAAEGNGDAWTTLGNVIAFTIGFIVSVIGVFVSVISAAVAIVSAAIEIVMSVFSGLADVITGVVFIIGGIINGSWTDIWTGMKLVAFGVVDAIIGVVLELAGAIAGVIDALTGLFGDGTRWQQGIRDFRSSLRADMAEGMGVQDLTFTRPTRPGAAAAPAPANATSSMPAVAAMTPAVPASFPMTPATPTPAPPVTVNLQVDGATLATAVHRADRDAATRGFSPVPTY